MRALLSEMAVVCALGVGSMLAVTAQEAVRPADVGAPAFTVHANPRWAPQVNEVLAELGEWIEMAIPAGANADDFLKSYCGGNKPAKSESTPQDAGIMVRFSPCVRLKRDVQVPVTNGDTLSGVAARSGLPPADAAKLKVKSTRHAEQSIHPQILHTGDIVVIPTLPLWTQVTAKSGTTLDRAAFVSAIAEKLKCTVGTAKEDCLLQRGVTVLDRGTVPKPPASDAPARQLPRVHFESMPLPAPPPIRSASAAASALGVPAADAPSDGVGARVAPVRAVAEDQWPFDVSLIAAMLTDPAVKINPVVIGVADGGLANKAGGPLPPDVFKHGSDLPDDNNVDDEVNDYVDDAIGGGIQGPREPLGSGDIGLCRGQPINVADWPAESVKLFSHGAVTASIAAGLKLRTSADIGKRLPQIVFFRMLPNACAPNADVRVGDGEMVTAFDYLATRSSVINISYDATTTRGFPDAMHRSLPGGNRLLVLPAGNDPAGPDLDLNPVCPACLGNDAAAASRTLVVGAATRELKRAQFSNFGERTVRLFAPGEPVGALNLKGERVPNSDTSTSYAAPLAALAVGLMESLGITDPDDVRDRLFAATWPLDDKDSRPERTNVGVLDLVKAVAVQHDAVEVIENNADGRSVRRTYVGKLLDPLSKVALCAGQPFQASAVQAVRLGDAAANGERTVRLYWKNRKVQGRRIIDSRPCRPTGNIRIDALTVGERTFPLSAVTEIQLRWNP